LQSHKSPTSEPATDQRRHIAYFAQRADITPERFCHPRRCHAMTINAYREELRRAG
jgi:hypothetical protein